MGAPFRIWLVFVVLLPSLCCRAQQSDDAAVMNNTLPSAPMPAANAMRALPLDRQAHVEVIVRDTPIHTLSDLSHIAISPIYVRKSDLEWLLPLAGASAAAFATDTTTMNDVVSKNPLFNDTSINISDGLIGGFIAAPIALFGMGEMAQRPRERETGILGSEAMVDAFIVDELTKLCTFRERPYVDNAQGEFYIGKSGVDSSFVSSHSMVAWSSAAVLAGESHSKWAQFAIYTAAAGVSVTRVTGQQHFPSDVLIGSAGDG